MSIGIIGSGAIGSAFALTLARVGIEATISNSRGPDSLKALVRELGPAIKAGTREEAARADIVFIAVNWTKLQAAMVRLKLSGRIVIDATTRRECYGFSNQVAPEIEAKRLHLLKETAPTTTHIASGREVRMG